MQEALKAKITNREHDEITVALPRSRQRHSPVVRAILILVGSVSVVLGVAGIFLPVLPTTPFLLLASACFARASERMHLALLNNRWCGPFLRDWRQFHAITRATRARAIFMVLATMTVSILLVDSWNLKAFLGLLCLVLVLFVMRLPVRPDDVN